MAGPVPWPGLLGDDLDHARMLLAAAVRETFEECGVLLARPASVHLQVDAGTLEQDRARLESHEATLTDVLDRHGLLPDVSSLRPWARWITPEDAPRRYDTRFFVAALPEGQGARHLTGEAVSARWVSGADALTDYREGRHHLMPPTWSLLRRLAECATVAEALAQPEVPEPVCPAIVVRTGTDVQVLFDGSDEYYADAPTGD